MVINYEKESYGEQRASDIMDEWGYPFQNRVETDSIHGRARNGLLGPERVTLLTIEGRDDRAKKALQETLDLLEQSPDDTIGNGLVILLQLPETLKLMKTLIATVKKLGGEYMVPKKNRDGEVHDIITQIHLNPSVQEALLEYVGESYDNLLPLVNSLKTMTIPEQRQLTLEDVMIRMPHSPGEIPLFGSGYGRNRVNGITDYIMDGSRALAMSKLERLLASGTPPLLILAAIKSKIIPMYRMRMLLENGATPEQASEALGLPNPKYSGKGEKDPRYNKSGYPTKLAITECRSWSLTHLTEATEAILRTESMLKGQYMRVNLTPENALYALVPIVCKQ